MKYSWKQRRWRAGGPIVHAVHAVLGTRLQARLAIGGLPVAVETRTDGFHMLSLAAKDALCCRDGNYVMLATGLRVWRNCDRPGPPGRSESLDSPRLAGPLTSKNHGCLINSTYPLYLLYCDADSRSNR